MFACKLLLEPAGFICRSFRRQLATALANQPRHVAYPRRCVSLPTQLEKGPSRRGRHITIHTYRRTSSRQCSCFLVWDVPEPTCEILHYCLSAGFRAAIRWQHTV
ncbi:hypothetical protein FIBSPDRAFT_462267 [Athelia psychrophila]|uniref:Uncharacterized protein n=1 Tax=Athelia psychrophila TaxID=1759441 RepID=A0A167U7P9_9AGAM|nr:hypothetical protein FIBSPDRAFT_462267 [Fibularhizoctonia sp. CBS 109695]